MDTTTIPHPQRDAGSRSISDASLVNAWLLWRPETPSQTEVLSIAQLADCRCPDLCDRDHFYE